MILYLILGLIALFGGLGLFYYRDSVSRWFHKHWKKFIAVFATATIVSTGVLIIYDEFGDTPLPPASYEWTLHERGSTYNIYYNESFDIYTMSTYSGHINYLNDTGVYNPIDTSIKVLPMNHPARDYGYIAGNEDGLYSIYFKENAQDSYPVCFAYNRNGSNVTHALRSELIGIGYYDPSTNHEYSILQTVLDSDGSIEGNTGKYNNILSGIDAEWVYEKYGFKENLILSNTTKTLLQNHPPSNYGYSNANSYVVMATKLDYKNIYPYNDITNISSNFTFNNGIKFKNVLGKILFSMPTGFVYEQNNISNTNDLIYRLVQYDSEYYLLSGIKVTTLNSMEFPVVFDPITDIDATSDDGCIVIQNKATWDSARDATFGSVDSSSSSAVAAIRTYYTGTSYAISRTFLEFDTSSLNEATITAAILNVCGFGQGDSSIIVINSDQGSSLSSSDFNNIDFNDEISDEFPVWTGITWNSINIKSGGLVAINTDGGDTTIAIVEHDHDYLDVAETSDNFSGCYFSEESGKEPYLSITYYYRPIVNLFNVDSDSGYNGYDDGNKDCQFDWNVTDGAGDDCTIYITYNIGSAPPTPTTTNYNFTSTTDVADSTTLNTRVGSSTDDWVNTSSGVYFRAIGWDGTYYSEVYVSDSITGIDEQIPTVTITDMDTGGDGYNGVDLNQISGTSADSHSGVERVDVTLENTTTSYYWNNVAWVSGSQIITESGTTAWSYDSSGVTWIYGGDYEITAIAYDNVGEFSTTATHQFTVPDMSIDDIYPQDSATDVLTHLQRVYAEISGQTEWNVSLRDASYTLLEYGSSASDSVSGNKYCNFSSDPFDTRYSTVFCINMTAVNGSVTQYSNT